MAIPTAPLTVPNDCSQRLATKDFPSAPILSRVRCIAWFAAIWLTYWSRSCSYWSWSPIQYQKKVSPSRIARAR